jgi:phosphopantothenate---cysteine ligase (CTP)
LTFFGLPIAGIERERSFCMNCIVTAGPTYEELDQVRRLTNFSTGTLGSELASYLAERGHEVELLRGHYSTCRIQSKARRQETFTTTADLRQRLEVLEGTSVDAVFHAAAVSDFAFGKVWTRLEDGTLKEVQSSKISTHGEAVLVELRPTPKIIAQLRRWFPTALLVGWKYELEGDRAQAIAQGEKQIKDNQTDSCVVNGWAYGAGFGLVRVPGECMHVPDKHALFAVLEGLVTAGDAPGTKPAI